MSTLYGMNNPDSTPDNSPDKGRKENILVMSYKLRLHLQQKDMHGLAIQISSIAPPKMVLF